MVPQQGSSVTYAMISNLFQARRWLLRDILKN